MRFKVQPKSITTLANLAHEFSYKSGDIKSEIILESVYQEGDRASCTITIESVDTAAQTFFDVGNMYTITFDIVKNK
jgi:hypothetical protein